MADIRHTQTTISNTLSELVAHLRGGAFTARSPSVYPPSFHQSPNISSPSMSTPTASHQHVNDMHPSPPGGSNTFPSSHASIAHAPGTRQARPSISNSGYLGSGPPQLSPTGDHHLSQGSPPYGNLHPSGQSFNNQNAQGPVLPPFSSFQSMGPPNAQQGNVSSVRYQAADPHLHKPTPAKYPTSGSKRHAPPSSNVTSADSSDFDDEDNGELPASGLVAPWEVLRGLADVAIERAAKVCFYI